MRESDGNPDQHPGRGEFTDRAVALANKPPAIIQGKAFWGPAGRRASVAEQRAERVNKYTIDEIPNERYTPQQRVVGPNATGCSLTGFR